MLGMEYHFLPKLDKKIKGVKTLTTAPFYKEVDVPVDHPVFSKQPTELCNYSKLPLLSYLQKHVSADSNFLATASRINPGMTLHVGLVPKKGQNGVLSENPVPRDWKTTTRPVFDCQQAQRTSERGRHQGCYHFCTFMAG